MASRRKRLAPKKEKKHVRWRVAVHEAGHAVAAHALGVQVDHVTILAGATKAGERYAGFTGLAYEPAMLRRALDEYFDDDDDADREEKTFFLLLKSMQVSFGGKVAEELFFGAAEEAGLTSDLESVNTCAELLCPPGAEEIAERVRPLSLDMNMDDIMAEAIKRMQQVPKQEYEYLLDWVELRARKLLRSRRDLVEAVALKLFERGTLTGAEVVATILSTLKRRWSRTGRPRALQG